MYALLPFIGLSVGMAVIRAIKARAGQSALDRVRLLGALGVGLVDSRRYVVLGEVSLWSGTLVLGFNLANEYIALGGEVAIADLPSVQSMLGRIGWTRTSSSPSIMLRGMADFETIRPIVWGKRVFIVSSRREFLPLTDSLLFAGLLSLRKHHRRGRKYLPQNSCWEETAAFRGAVGGAC